MEKARKRTNKTASLFQKKPCCFCFFIVALIAPTVKAQNWVDMGFRGENEDVIYWSSSDFIIYDNGTVGFAGNGEGGSVFGWGDVSGEKSGGELSQYGGVNPPKCIEGNIRYDIVAAKLGSRYRLPTYTEMQALIDNCEITVTSVDMGIPKGINGLPSWVQGQWLINDVIMIRGRGGYEVYNSAVSIRIDGVIASYYITSSNDFWEGTYQYSDGIISIGRIDLIVDDENRVLKDIGNNVFRKISNHTVSNKKNGLLFKSKINGNTLLFVMPPVVTSYSSGAQSITWKNEQETAYWTGTLFANDNEMAIGMKLTLDGLGMVAEPRNYHKRIRPIKVDVGSGLEVKRRKHIEDSIAREKKRISDSIKFERKRISDSIARERYIADSISMATRIQHLYGEWGGKNEIRVKIKVFIDSNRMYIYEDGEKIYDGPIKIFINKYGSLIFQDDTVIRGPRYYQSKHETGILDIFSGRIVGYSFRYDNLMYNDSMGCFQIDCRTDCHESGYRNTETIYLKKDSKKKKNKKRRSE